MGWTEGIIAVLGITLGFIAGLITFKRSNRWCPACGGQLRCRCGDMCAVGSERSRSGAGNAVRDVPDGERVASSGRRANPRG